MVAADADLDAAARAVATGGFYASGQACISVQRLIVEAPVYDEFIELAAAKVSQLRFGDPREPDTQVSRLIDVRATERVKSWITEAVSAGAAEVVSRNHRRVTDADSAVRRRPRRGDLEEEVFGPVVVAAANMDAAFDLVNESRYGLHASVFTSSLHTAMRAIRRLKVGGVVINEVPASGPTPCRTAV